MLRKLAIIACLLLAACGGGGGGGGDSLQLSFSPNPLIASFYAYQLPAGVTVEATVQGSTSASTVYVLIKDSGGTFQSGAPSLVQTGTNSYQAGLTVAASLAVGAHSGTLQVLLCTDTACQSVLGQSTLPYTVTIKANPPPTLSSVTPSPLAATVLQGSALSITVNFGGYASGAIYGSIQDPAGLFSASRPFGLIPTGTFNTYTAILPVTSGNSDGTHGGTLSFKACYDPACSSVIGSTTVPYTIKLATLLGGTPGVNGYTDGPASSSQFYAPEGVAVDKSGNVFIADTNNHVIRKIDTSGSVSTFAIGVGLPEGITIDAAGAMFVSDAFHNRFLQITQQGSAIIYAGSGSGIGGGDNITPNNPEGLAVDSTSGAIFVADAVNGTIDRVGTNGIVEVFAGTINSSGSVDGNGMNALFQLPSDVAIDKSGNVYVTDYGNSTIRKISPSADVTTVAGMAGAIGDIDANGSAAEFGQPSGIAIDTEGNLYIADPGNFAIRKVDPALNVTTVFSKLTLSNGQLLAPNRIAVGADGALYVTDNQNHVVVRTAVP